MALRTSATGASVPPGGGIPDGCRARRQLSENTVESRYRDSTIDVHHRVDSPVRPSEESGQCLRDDLAGL
ncbi:MAG: hypothetical protein E6581_09070, partial [Cutibacterium granulosum]|nr:hypothetical protein [Cutibacterium granulosum]